MPDIPAEAFQAAETAIREGVRIRLGENALVEACEGRPVMLSGTEAEEAARLAVEAVAPMLLAQARAEERARVVAHIRALAKNADHGGALFRMFTGRHATLAGSSSLEALLDAVADEIRCGYHGSDDE